MTKEELEKQLPLLLERLPYEESEEITEDEWELAMTSLLNDSKSIALEVLFPFEDFSEYLLPKSYYNWQLRCCVELYNLADKQGFTSYSENYLSWTRYRDGLSSSLMNSLNSKVGIPKRREQDV